jgi:shikimate dehydrogenase
MKRLAVLGHPIGHSLSPAIYNAAFPAMGIDATYEAWDIAPEDIAGAIERMRGPEMLGGNVTVPHKLAVMPLLDEVEPAAQAIGAVNCIANHEGSLTGYNTDKYGFIRSLREAGFGPEQKTVLVLGAGGAARAVGVGLGEAGAAVIWLAGRNHSHVEATTSDLRLTLPDACNLIEVGWHDADFAQACGLADLIVNCTPVGMHGTTAEGESPLSAELIRPGVWACDLVYRPLETVFLRQAREAGASCVGGLEMLIYQAVESVRLWTGREAPVDIMRNAAMRALGYQD